MKKFLSLFCTLILCLTCTVTLGCQEKNSNELTFYAPDGAPALAIAKFINDKENFDGDYNFDYNVVTASNIGSIMSQGKGDFIIMPVNAASKLYKTQADDPYKMVSVITHGNLYIMSSECTDLESLKGKVVGVIGEGQVPDLTFQYVLKTANIEYDSGDTAIDGKVVMHYYNSATELLPMMKTGKIKTGLLPEPAATKLTTMSANFTNRIDLQKLYDTTNESYPQAVLMVKSSVINNNPKIIEKIKEKFADNIAWVKENTESAVNAVNGALNDGATASLQASAITATVVDNCKIYWQGAVDAKNTVINYIEAIKGIENTSADKVTDEFFLL